MIAVVIRIEMGRNTGRRQPTQIKSPKPKCDYEAINRKITREPLANSSICPFTPLLVRPRHQELKAEKPCTNCNMEHVTSAFDLHGDAAPGDRMSITTKFIWGCRREFPHITHSWGLGKCCVFRGERTGNMGSA